MITYECIYSAGNGRPLLNKVFEVPSGDPIKIPMNMGMPQSDIDDVPTELIFNYLDSLVLYIKESSESLRAIQLDEPRGDYQWTMWGWAEINWAKVEYDEWWRYAFYSRDTEE